MKKYYFNTQSILQELNSASNIYTNQQTLSINITNTLASLFSNQLISADLLNSLDCDISQLDILDEFIEELLLAIKTNPSRLDNYFSNSSSIMQDMYSKLKALYASNNLTKDISLLSYNLDDGDTKTISSSLF